MSYVKTATAIAFAMRLQRQRTSISQTLSKNGLRYPMNWTWLNLGMVPRAI